MNQLTSKIIKYRILYLSTWISLISMFVYSIHYNEWALLVLSLIYGRFIALFGVIIGLHRYFSHKSFNTGKWRKRFLLGIGILSAEGSPISWAVHHRHHHRYSDSDKDIHSPTESILLSSVLWQVKKLDWWLNKKEVKTFPKDLMRDKEINFVDQNYYNIWLTLAIITLCIDWKILVFFLLGAAGWSHVFGIVINTLCHSKFIGNYRNFETNDSSYNNKFLSIITFGEALHNNHHAKSSSVSNRVHKGEFDFAGWIIDKFFVLDLSSITNSPR